MLVAVSDVRDEARNACLTRKRMQTPVPAEGRYVFGGSAEALLGCVYIVAMMASAQRHRQLVKRAEGHAV